MEVFVIALNAVVPFMIYMGLGLFVKWAMKAEESFFGMLNSVTYNVFLPIMLFMNTFTIDLANSFDLRFNGVYLAVMFASLFLFILMAKALTKSGKEQGAIVLSCYRTNIVLFSLPLLESVIGQEGVAIATMPVTLTILVSNVVAIFMLSFYGGEKADIKKTLKGIATNPLLLGTIVGFMANLAGLKLPYCVTKPFGAISDLCTPLAFFVLGGTIHFSSMRKNIVKLSVTIAAKLIVVPAIIYAIARLCGLGADEAFVMFSLFAVPSGVTNYAMAVGMNCDGELTGEISVLSNIVALATLFFWIAGLKATGLL